VSDDVIKKTCKHQNFEIEKIDLYPVKRTSL